MPPDGYKPGIRRCDTEDGNRVYHKTPDTICRLFHMNDTDKINKWMDDQKLNGYVYCNSHEVGPNNVMVFLKQEFV